MRSAGTKCSAGWAKSETNQSARVLQTVVVVRQGRLTKLEPQGAAGRPVYGPLEQAWPLMRDDGESLGGKVMTDCDGSPTKFCGSSADLSSPLGAQPSGHVSVLRYGRPQFSQKRMYVAPEFRATRRSFDHRSDCPCYAGSRGF
jgi:hypothetical protein